MNKLPLDIIKYILSFDKRFIIRNNKILIINKINKKDYRYNILYNISEKKKYYDIKGLFTSVRLYINKFKDFYLIIRDCEIILETVIYNSFLIVILNKNTIKIN